MTKINLLALIGRDTQLKRTCSKHGGEYSGPCPLCRCGVDRFKVWPQMERWACLGPNAGRSGCDRGGDAIQYLRERDGLTYREACERLNINLTAKHNSIFLSANSAQSPRLCVEPPLSPPNPTWQAHGKAWAARCAVLLWRPEAARARDYLHHRGLQDEVLSAFNVGYNPHDVYEDHVAWGLTRQQGGSKCIWLPRGITFPWYYPAAAGSLWRLNVRRPLTTAQIKAGQAKYIGPAGFANALYNAASLRCDRPAVLVEGEIDALTIVQACGDQIAVVATGSTAGARAPQWVARLALAPLVLLAFDNDANAAGDKAAAWWRNVLPKAHRWPPLLHDVNSRPQVKDVRAWIERALKQFA